ncbi:carboxymuconolactone decarboxylase family protein [Sphingobium sp. UBA5915]|uniref:carboxymuconolactone decarboxylase family protein n=1 Tax=Sphingobium sp. UBA5915 TaxID=1947530 RepID=UPI0025CF76CE|nr:carboxymuconolactone decarboxylase family protein [Sphingobium sp. UBA5915]
MSDRIGHMRQVPALTQKLTELTFALKKGPVEQSILSLVEIRASQLNGCAFCLDAYQAGQASW